VDKIETGYEEVSHSQKKEIIVVQVLAGVPCDEEDAPGHHNAEYLREAVEEQIIVHAGQVQEDQNDDSNGGSPKYSKLSSLVGHNMRFREMAELPSGWFIGQRNPPQVATFKLTTARRDECGPTTLKLLERLLGFPLLQLPLHLRGLKLCIHGKLLGLPRKDL